MRTPTMRRGLFARAAKAIGLAAAVTAMTIAASAGPAAAEDKGDGIVECNSGEICFTLWSNGYTDPGVNRKQFWYGANHHTTQYHPYYQWWNVTFGYSNGPVMDTAHSVRNRDTSCYVYLWDVDGFGNWYIYNNMPSQQGGYNNSVDERNNGHSRCITTSPARL